MQELDDNREPLHLSERALNGRPSDGMWSVLGTLFRWRWFIVGVTSVVAAAAVVISLLLPNWYAASARVLPPESGGANPITSALLRSGAGSAASALLGGVSSDYARYLAILSSRRVLGDVVDRFDLVTAYDLADDRHPRETAMEMLEDNVSFPVDGDYEFLSVIVLDRDPRRAAAIANFMVRRLNEVNSELASQSAGNFRAFIEGRFQEAQTALDSVLDATQAFQRQYGVLDLDVQSQAYFNQLASLEASATLAEIQYEALLAQLGPENSEVQALHTVARAAQAKVQAMLNGSESVLPIPRGAMSTVARRYVDLQRGLTIQSQILEAVSPLVEQARYEEEKTIEAVQVVDIAVPPVRKAKPRRSVIVVVATLTAFLLASLFVVLYTGWKRNHAYVARRLGLSVRQGAPRKKTALPT